MSALRNRSSTPALARAMRAWFTQYGIGATVHVGINARSRWGNEGLNGSRVVIIPGEFSGGQTLTSLKGGAIGPRETHADLNDTVNGYRQRCIATWNKVTTLSIWACDPTDKTSEEAQLEATEDLFEVTMQAVYYGVDPQTQQFLGLSNVVWGSQTWTKPPGEMGFGQEILVTFVHTGVLYAPALDTTAPGAAVNKPTITNP